MCGGSRIQADSGGERATQLVGMLEMALAWQSEG